MHFNVAADAGSGDDDSDILSSLDDVTCTLFDGSYEGSQHSPTSLVAGTCYSPPLCDQDDVFYPLLSSGGSQMGCVSTATNTRCQPEIPVPPDISPLLHSSHSSTDEQVMSRVPTPPDITPLLKGALSSANIQLSSSASLPSVSVV